MNIILIVFILFFTSCTDTKKKDEYEYTEKICDNWYVEYYKIKHNEYLYLTHDTYNCYLTDFDKVDYFISDFDEDEGYRFSCL